MSRHGQHQTTARSQGVSQGAQCPAIVFQVFQNVEHADQVEWLAVRQLVQIAVTQRAVDAPPGKFQLLGDEVHSDHFAVRADLCEHAQDIAVAAADFQDSVARRQLLHKPPDETANDGVAGAEPEVPVFRVEQTGREVRQLDRGR